MTNDKYLDRTMSLVCPLCKANALSGRELAEHIAKDHRFDATAARVEAMRVVFGAMKARNGGEDE